MRIALVLVVFVAGCSSWGQAKWTKDGSTAKDFDTAHAQCEAEAIHRANAIATHISHAFYGGCMKAAGWTPPPAPKEEEHEAPKKAENHAAANDTAKHDAPKQETAAAEAPKH
jgi:hypothetical protein